MKILFLDIDGVICSIRSAVAFGGYPWKVDKSNIDKFDIVAINLIRKICEETDTKIILSSIWRLSEGYEALSKSLNLPMIGQTPSLHLSRRRGEEINQWLLEHPEISQYVIVDDDTDMLENQLSHFVKVDSRNGLSFENYDQILRILSKEERK